MPQKWFRDGYHIILINLHSLNITNFLLYIMGCEILSDTLKRRPQLCLTIVVATASAICCILTYYFPVFSIIKVSPKGDGLGIDMYAFISYAQQNKSVSQSHRFTLSSYPLIGIELSQYTNLKAMALSRIILIGLFVAGFCSISFIPVSIAGQCVSLANKKQLRLSGIVLFYIGIIPVLVANAWFAAIRYGFGNNPNVPELEVKLGNGIYTMYAVLILNLVIYIIGYYDIQRVRKENANLKERTESKLTREHIRDVETSRDNYNRSTDTLVAGIGRVGWQTVSLANGQNYCSLPESVNLSDQLKQARCREKNTRDERDRMIDERNKAKDELNKLSHKFTELSDKFKAVFDERNRAIDEMNKLSHEFTKLSHKFKALPQTVEKAKRAKQPSKRTPLESVPEEQEAPKAFKKPRFDNPYTNVKIV